MLHDLCKSCLIIAVQEHWLRSDELHKLHNFETNFSSLAASGMNKKCCENIINGRPFGGVAFLINNSILEDISLIGNNESGRCIAMMYKCNARNFLICNVYFPCISSLPRNDYINELCDIMGYIEFIICNNVHDYVIICGDTNFNCNNSHQGYSVFSQLLNENNMVCCDNLNKGKIINTYFNESLNRETIIDHFFVSAELLTMIADVEVVDSGANLSDHRPIILNAQVNVLNAPNTAIGNNTQHADNNNKQHTQYKVRWDKGSLNDYYERTRQELQSIDLHCYSMKCSNSQDGICRCLLHTQSINQHYNSIVKALKISERECIPSIPQRALKAWWNDELNDLKQKSIFWHECWVNAKRPTTGPILTMKNNAKWNYKIAIKRTRQNFDNKFNENLLDYHLNKKPKEFWKTWAAKFKAKSIKPILVNGSKDCKKIAETFADNFKSVYCDSYENKEAVDELLALLNDPGNLETCKKVTVETVDKCIKQLHKGRASGLDDLSAEHLLHAHPSLVVHLTMLFNNMFNHAFVPEEFGSGVIIPIIKNKQGNISDPANYRGITLIPVISKLFELIISELYEELLVTDNLQFGFKKQQGCTNALFMFQEIVHYFNERGSTIFGASLDFKKAFDRVNHCKLLALLIRKKFPKFLIMILMCWYSKLEAVVRWQGTFSNSFGVKSGVRQGSTLSPMLFNCFVNIFIEELQEKDIGCKIGNKFVGIIMYADDVILLSASVTGLQKMLDCVSHVSSKVDLPFNCDKCCCFAIGAQASTVKCDMYLYKKIIAWEKRIKYLGIEFLCGKILKIDTSLIQRKFYSATNCILGTIKTASEIIKLCLLESYALPILLYGIIVCRMSRTQINELNVCWNTAIRKIFGYNRWESVRLLLSSIYRVDVFHNIIYRNLSFCKKGCTCHNATFKCVLYKQLVSPACMKTVSQLGYDNVVQMVCDDKQKLWLRVLDSYKDRLHHA